VRRVRHNRMHGATGGAGGNAGPYPPSSPSPGVVESLLFRFTAAAVLDPFQTIPTGWRDAMTGAATRPAAPAHAGASPSQVGRCHALAYVPSSESRRGSRPSPHKLSSPTLERR